MNSLDNLWVVCFKLTEISNCRLLVFFDFLKNHFQVLSIKREAVLEGMLSLFRSLHQNCCNLINKVNFRNEHSGDKRTNQCVVFKVHIKLDGLHTETTT